jgi:hypothetical protein
MSREGSGFGVIIWLNGRFGVGKTATARELTATMPDALAEVASSIRNAVQLGD